MEGEQVIGTSRDGTHAIRSPRIGSQEERVGSADRRTRPALLGAVVAAGLDAQAHQLLFGAALHEQRHEIPDRAPVEPRMIQVDHRGDGIRRTFGVDAQAVDQLFNRRPLRTPTSPNPHTAIFALRLPDSTSCTTSGIASSRNVRRSVRAHHQRLSAAAQIFRLKHPGIKRRLLEIGCTGGGNVIPYAAAHPDTRVVGVICRAGGGSPSPARTRFRSSATASRIRRGRATRSPGRACRHTAATSGGDEAVARQLS